MYRITVTTLAGKRVPLVRRFRTKSEATMFKNRIRLLPKTSKKGINPRVVKIKK